MFTYLTEMWNLAIEGNTQGVWFWGAVYAVLACFYSAMYQIRVRTWPTTVGNLKHASVSEFGALGSDPAEQNYHANVCYTYTVNGRIYEGNRVSAWVVITNNNFRKFLQNQLDAIDSNTIGQVVVYYNPAKPAKSYLVLPKKLGVAFTLLLGVLPGIGYYSRYYM